MKYFGLLLLLFYSIPAISNVRIYPLRVIMNDKQRSTTVSLKNSTTEEQTYTLKAVFYNMKPTGGLVMSKTPKQEESSLVKNLKFSPRRVTLRPGESQVVRIIVKNTGSLESGDYRAHLRVVPDVKKLSSNANPNQAALLLQGRVAVSVPIIYFKGKKEAKGEISNLKLLDEKEKGIFFELDLKNIGKNFLLGDMEIYITDNSNNKELIGNLNGISSYIKERKVKFKLHNLKKLPPKGSKLRVVYKAAKELGGDIIADSEVTL